nr:hypothetical protein [Armatimonas sp.]
MTQTLEFTIPELIQKWNLGQIPTDAKVSVTFEDKKPAKKTALSFGMFQGNFPDLTLEDFKVAEHRDDPEDELAL